MPSRATTSFPSSSSSHQKRSSPPARPNTPTSSGPSMVAAATSAPSPNSSSRPTSSGPRCGLASPSTTPRTRFKRLPSTRRSIPSCPDHVGWHAALKQSMPGLPFVPEPLRGKRLLLMIVMYLADSKEEEGEKLVERLIGVGKPAAKAMTVMPFGARVQKLLDPEFPNGNRYYTKEAHINELPEEALEILVSRWGEMKMSGEIEIIGLGGAMARVSPDATAFANRHHNWWLNFALHWDQAELDASNIAQIRAANDALKPWLGIGVYANMLNFDEADRLIDAYGGQERYDRIARVKAQYDPDNFFRSNNAAIVPIGGAATHKQEGRATD